jgi:hypothetical protein
MDESGASPVEHIAVNLWILDEVHVRDLPVELLDGRNQW